ncbi:hypothetical protein [Marinobacter sp.]|uniref:gp53-like domain-containing protein n=1 Tax=Marinobacter sp. TaxID=50741 RepID=UPI000C8A2F31|nr:hypothetical protein [Marinobacter sp.]MAB53544.1 hypothetical protein [Marinobacter sp.]|tara:strand:+ start:1116 stop:1898 length:783 start_codon:yes stop_codon:yes gene_type:complete
MAEVTRYSGNLKAFAEDAQGTERTVFDDVTQSDTLDDNLNTEYFRGWGITGVNENPTKQDFNAVGFTHGSLLKYLFQRGVPEWDALQEYYAPAVTLHNGELWIATTDPTVGDEPGVDAPWVGLQSLATETAPGIIKLATDAETNAGTTGALAVSPPKLKASFAASITANGYIRFPSWLGGLMIQWGSVTSVSSTTVVTFPVAFPNNFFRAFAQSADSTFFGGMESASPAGSYTTTGMNVSSYQDVSGAAVGEIFWMALGN